MSKWIEVWGDLGWVKRRSIGDLQAFDVFRVMSEKMTGACLVVNSIVKSNGACVMKTRLLNRDQTLVCEDCDARLDESSHKNKCCPVCGNEVLTKPSDQSKEGLVVRQEKQTQRTGVFH